MALPQNSEFLASPARYPTLMPFVPSVFTLLSRNLRLLNLDKLDDWPGITEETFAFRDDVRAKSKTRFRRAEWLIFRLFQLWDPEATKANLDIYFPPLEPLQSIKLRSTAFLLLEEMKREGVLSRACPLRKSMLDDCIGPKFDELLLAFSTVVLQKQAESANGPKLSGIGVASRQDSHEQEASHMTIIAFSLQSALKRSLASKQRYRQRYEELSNEFEVRKEYFNLLEECNGVALDGYKESLRGAAVDAETLKRKLRTSVQGGQTWLNIALSGEPHADRDALAESNSFDEVWNRANAGLAPQTEAKNQKELIASLEDVATSQENRLRRWRTFQSKVSQRNGDLIVTRSPSNSPRKTPRRPGQNSPSKSSHRKLSETRPKGSHPKSASPHKHASIVSTPENYFKYTDAPQQASQRLEYAIWESAPSKANESVEDTPFNHIDSRSGQRRSSHQKSESSSLITGDNQQVSGDVEAMGPRTPMLSLAQRTRNSMANVTHVQHLAPASSEVSPGVHDSKQNLDIPIDTLNQEMLQMSLGQRAQVSMAQLQRSSSAKNPVRNASHRKSRSGQLTRKPAFPVNPFGARRTSVGSHEHYGLDPVGDCNPSDLDFEEGASGPDLSGQDAVDVFMPRSKLRRSPPGGSPVAAGASHNVD